MAEIPNMTAKDWQKFFDYLERIVDAPMSVAEKIEAVKEAAEDVGGNADMNVEEFTAWLFE